MKKGTVVNNQSLPAIADSRMRWILFLVITIFFIVITTLTILAVFTDIVDPGQQYQDKLFYTFLVEIGVALFALFYSVFKLNPFEKSQIYGKAKEHTEEAVEFAKLEHSRSRMRNIDTDIRALKGHWRAQWFLEGIEEPYVEDEIWINEVAGNEIHGKGIDKKGTYEFEGLYLRGVLNLVYKYTEQGYSLAGVIVLKVGAKSKTARGKWYGYLEEDEINGGNVEWEKI